MDRETNDTESTPQPTYAPAGMAMGIAMTAFGVVTYWTVSVAGVLLVAFALGMWMVEICQQWGRGDES